ncbi:MAG TPA: hypothetical protein VFX13_20035 [Gaiellales bacterium]|jgi:hypothetical protein|nr:hypothetical protein [Gaiellales bacterium]
MSAPPAPRPLDVGRALDLALLIYRRHFVTLVVAMGVAVVPLGLLTITPSPWGVIGALLQTIVLAGITPGVATLVVSDARSGAEPTVSAVWGRLAPMLAGLVLSVGLAYVLAALSMILLFVPFLLFVVWWQFTGQVVVVERRTFLAAMRRSRHLVQGSYWRVAGYLILSILITGVASGALAAAPTAAALQFGVHVAAATAIRDALTIAARVLVAPVGALLMALLYFDLRMRQDGSDIAAMLDALPSAPFAGAPR